MERAEARAHPWAEQVRAIALLEMASEMVSDRAWRQPPNQVRLQMRKQGVADPWDYALFASDTLSAIDEVARGDVLLAIINPAAALSLAVRGTGPFLEPLPLRVITTIPTLDQFGFAVAERTGITSLAEIRERRYPLKVSMRDQADHASWMLVNEVLGALGFSLQDIVSWGGEVVRRTSLRIDPKAVQRGDYDAFFEEAVRVWIGWAANAGMRLLPLESAASERLESIGWRCTTLSRDEYPQLAADVLTPDFSGWPIVSRADTPDDLVRWVCTSLEARKDRIPHERGWALPLERMCKEGPDTPLVAPLHPAAETFWRERGYLP